MRVFAFCLLFVFFSTSCATKNATVLRSPSSGTPTKVGVKGAVTSKKSAVATKSLAGLDYIETYKWIAVREMNQYGIPASIKLAQALLESGNGNSYLAKEANNHFGIKCGGVWDGKSITKSDDNPNDCFRKYDLAEDSYRDHSQFLLRKRYEKLFTLDKDDYRGWAKGLKEAGYATNPKYPDLLIGLIERYDLHQYDKHESHHQKRVRERNVGHIIEDKSVEETVVEVNQIKTPVAMIIHEVKPSQTLYGISKQYNVSEDQIIRLNGLNTTDLSIGQLLIISK